MESRKEVTKRRNHTVDSFNDQTQFHMDLDLNVSNEYDNFQIIQSREFSNLKSNSSLLNQKDTNDLNLKSTIYTDDGNFVVISSKPINIVNNVSQNQTHEGKSPIQQSLKNYITHSFNLIKESANYLSGNYKSI